MRFLEFIDNSCDYLRDKFYNMAKKRWLKYAKKVAATHILVEWDSYEADCMPIYIMPGQDIEEMKKRFSNYPSSVAEVIIVS